MNKTPKQNEVIGMKLQSVLRVTYATKKITHCITQLHYLIQTFILQHQPKLVLLCCLNVTFCIKSISTNIITIENLFQMFVVLVFWANQKVNLRRITDFWITETITVEEKALESVKKGKIIDEETVVVQWNSSEKDTMKLNNLIWTNKDSFMGRSFQWTAYSTWVGTIIKEDNTRFNPKIPLWLMMRLLLALSKPAITMW